MGRVSCVLSKDLLKSASMIELQDRHNLDNFFPPLSFSFIFLYNNYISISILSHTCPDRVNPLSLGSFSITGKCLPVRL
jgi:hypothetical protein